MPPIVPGVAHRERKAGFDVRYLERHVALTLLHLYQLHDCCCREEEGRTSAESHTLLYMLMGSGALNCNGMSQPISHRHFVKLNQNSAYRIEANPGEVIRFVKLELQPTGAMLRHFPLFELEASNRVIPDMNSLDEQIYLLMRELRSTDRHKRAMLDSLVNQIAIQAGRMLGGSVKRRGMQEEFLTEGHVPLQKQVTSQERLRHKSGGKKELIYQAVQYIDQSIDQIEELGQVAESLGYSYSYLSHAFRLEMGMSMQSYWVGRRMMAAMNKLQAGRGSITQISEELRYQSIHAFSKSFKKMTGFTPSEYQSLYGAGDNDE